MEAELELGTLELLMSKRSSDLPKILCMMGGEYMATFLDDWGVTGKVLYWG